jgi:hypothetical protein
MEYKLHNIHIAYPGIDDNVIQLNDKRPHIIFIVFNLFTHIWFLHRDTMLISVRRPLLNRKANLSKISPGSSSIQLRALVGMLFNLLCKCHSVRTLHMWFNIMKLHRSYFIGNTPFVYSDCTDTCAEWTTPNCIPLSGLSPIIIW